VAELFGLPEISYLQPVGLLIHSHLLFEGDSLRRYSDRRGASDHGRRFASRDREHMAEEKGEA
jgi:hypothetical protein